MKMQIIATGLSGLVGTRLRELLDEKYFFTDLSYATGVDITDYDQVEKCFKGSDAKIILHLAAKTDVDGCEDDKILGEEGASWQVNVKGTENICEAAKKSGKKVIYISTDFVFDGTKDFYNEEDKPDPVNWYGRTKYEGEKIVLKDESSVVVRIAYPYRTYFQDKKDFVARILDLIKQGDTLFGVIDHIMTPTFVDDIAFGLDELFQRDLSGIYHVVGGSSISAYDAIYQIGKVFGLEPNVKSVKREEYFNKRAFRPFKLILKNDKIQKLGVKMHTFTEGLFVLKKQLMISQ